MEVLNRTQFRTQDEAAKTYFELGLQHRAILSFLKEFHDMHLSLRSLQRRLHRLGLRRLNFSNVAHDVTVRAVRQELSGKCADNR